MELSTSRSMEESMAANASWEGGEVGAEEFSP